MRKVIKRIRRWFEFNGRILAIVLVIVGVLAVGVWHASQPEEIVQEDFGDASISEVAHEISDFDYAGGIQLLINGEEAKGRAVLQRLAPLNQGSKEAKGHAKAHLWMARDLMGDQKVDFLAEFPLDASRGRRLPASTEFEESLQVVRAQRHLESARELEASLTEAVVLLAELHIVQKQRNEAIEVLINAIAEEEGSNTGLILYLANSLAYKGDELGLKESIWHDFATLGQEVTSEKRSDMNARVKYLVDAMVLKQFDLAEIGIGKFERDFSEVGGREKLMSGLRAGLAYMQAIALLDEDDTNLVTVADFLIEAHNYQPGRLELVAALKALITAEPSLKTQIKSALGGVSSSLEEKSPIEAAALHMFSAELNPQQAKAHIMKAKELTPENAELVALWVESKLTEQGVDLVALLLAIEQVFKQERMNKKDRYLLCITRGKVLIASEQWKEALQSLEQALAMDIDVNPVELHSLLGKSYADLGLKVIADEHLLLAAE